MKEQILVLNLGKHNERCCSIFQISISLQSLFHSFPPLHGLGAHFLFPYFTFSETYLFIPFVYWSSQQSAQYPTNSKCSTNIYWVKKYLWLTLLIIASSVQFSSVQSLSHVWLFVTPWTAARQASLAITNSRSPFKPMSIESVMASNHLILCRPLLLLPSIFPSIRVFLN